ncbi:MAG: tetratricopeptide repeat protein [Nitrospirae bacterium]|nr:tetratricopeptide repeat protein [Nitrospirota bacterium]
MAKSGDASLVKITRPHYAGVLLQKRLFSLLDHARKKPVIWICGPPGAGKTVLVSSYIDGRKLPSLWYQVDEGDSDAASFFYYMGLAAKNAAPSKKRSLPLLTPEYIPGLSTFTRRYFENLFNNLKVPSCLVFDNCQDVPEDSGFYGIIREGFKAIPSGVNVIMLCRNCPPDFLARMEVNHLMEVIGWDNLCLTPEESEGVMRLKLKGRLSKEMLQECHNNTGGWVAGLMLILERIKRGEIGTNSWAGVTNRTISDYFHAEIFQKIDRDTQDFLLKTSFLPDMDAGMARNLTGLDSAEHILSDLNRNHFFTDKRPHKSPVYQYHPLFREFLLSHARDYFPHDDISKIQQKAGTILEESGRFENAFDLYRNVCNWDGIARLVMKSAQTLMAQGRNRVLEEWITSLPGGVVDNDPYLLYWLGLSHLFFDPVQAGAQLKRALNLFRKQGDATGVFLTWSSIVQSITHFTMNLKELDQWIELIDELMETFGAPPPGEINAGVTNNMFMALVYRQPQNPVIDSWAERVHTLLQGCHNIGVKVPALVNLAYYRARLGDFEAAEAIIASFQKYSKDRDAMPQLVLLMKWMESTYLSLTGAHERCLGVVLDAVHIADSTGVHVFDFVLLGHGVLSALNAGDFQTAERFLNRMASSLGGARPIDQSFYHSLMAHKALLRGNVTQADSHTKLMWEKGRDTGFPVIDYVYHLERAYVMYGLQEYEESAYHLTQSYKKALMMKSKPFEFMSLIAEAQIALERGKEEDGLESLKKAMALGRKYGFSNTYIWFPKVMARLCCKALEAGIEVDYVQELIRRRHVTPETPPSEIEDWPWPVRIYTLGRFELVNDGKAVRFSRKVKKRPLAMLKLLIASGGRHVREDQIIDTLWPESEGDLAHKAFGINIVRLRELVGAERAISFQDGLVTLDPHYCWVDVWAFERILGRAEGVIKEGDRERAIPLMEKAIALYKGGFLADSQDYEWAMLLRERLRSKFLRYTGELGRIYENMGEFNKAIETLKKGIEVDPLAEEFYQRLIACYHRLGRRAEALAIYNNLRKIFSATIGLSPSPQTEAIYKTLLSG